jgi:hypothetical protein
MIIPEIAALSILLLSRGAIPEIHGNAFCSRVRDDRVAG